MFDPNAITSTTQQQNLQYQQSKLEKSQTTTPTATIVTATSLSGAIQKEASNNNVVASAVTAAAASSFPTFCYANVNMIQKLAASGNANATLAAAAIAAVGGAGNSSNSTSQQQGTQVSTNSGTGGGAGGGVVSTQASTVNLAQLTDDKCYTIAQPFGYNYALVNQMSLTQNSFSNITFKCDVCGLMFTQLGLLNQHKRIHHQQHTDPTQIAEHQQITLQVQQQSNNAPAHIQIVTADRIRFSCDECALTFATQTDIKNHKLQHHSQQQQQQQQQHGTHHQQHSHHHQQQQQHHHQGNNHSQQQHHSGSASSTLTVATASGNTTIKLKGCDSCGIPTPIDTSIVNKKRALVKVKCENCLSTEALQQQATQIYVVTTGTDGGTATVEFEDAASAQSALAAHLTTGTQNSIPIGVKNAHPVKRRGIASVTKCTKCNGSGIIFIGGTKNQQNNIDKPFHCNICNGSFSRYSSLWSHRRLHTGEKNFKCTICGLAFAKAAYLKNHSRIHTGEKPYRCNVCGMQFSQSPHLKNHERIHSGERPYVCEVCEKSFARHSTLWNHRRIHTGEKPYRCDICGSCFNQATHLKNHAKVHSGEKPFKCDICSVGFSDRFALKRHRNIHEKYARTKSVTLSTPTTVTNAVGAVVAQSSSAGGVSEAVAGLNVNATNNGTVSINNASIVPITIVTGAHMQQHNHHASGVSGSANDHSTAGGNTSDDDKKFSVALGADGSSGGVVADEEMNAINQLQVQLS